MNQKEQEKQKNEQYRKMTAELIGKLEKVQAEKVQELLNNIKIKESKKQRVYEFEAENITELRLESPSYQDRADVVFLAALEDGLKKGELAELYLDISPNYFSMIRKPEHKRKRDERHKPSQDLIVAAALVNRRPFKLEDVNHVLMEIELPGLFTDTYIYDKNLRNSVLAKILNYAQNHDCPRERWILFTWEALDYLGLRNLSNIPVDTSQLTMKEETLLDGWLAEAKKECVRTDYMEQRRKHLDDYAKAHNITRSKAIAKLAELTYIDISTIRDVFASEFAGKDTHGDRTTIIQVAAHMGCTLEEINTLLRQANYPLLYPFRKDNFDAINIVRALSNKVAREQKMAKQGQN